MTDWKERQKRIKAQYFGEAGQKCLDLVDNEHDLTDEEREQLFKGCLVHAQDHFETAAEHCEIQKESHWIFKERRYQSCLRKEVTQKVPDLPAYIRAEAESLRTHRQEQEAKTAAKEEVRHQVLADLKAFAEESLLPKGANRSQPSDTHSASQKAPALRILPQPTPGDAPLIRDPLHETAAEGRMPMIQEEAASDLRFDTAQDGTDAEEVEDAIKQRGASKSLMLTRKYGLQLIGAKQGQHDPCLKELPRLFTEFQAVVNWMIQAGLQIGTPTKVTTSKKTGRTYTHRLFENEGKSSEKWFYREVVSSPTFQKLMQITERIELVWNKKTRQQEPRVRRQSRRTTLKERVWRCAAQIAYYAVREVKFRHQLLPRLTDILVRRSDFRDQLFERSFPSSEVVREAQAALVGTLFPITPGQRSPVYLRNILCHLRNLILTALRTTYAPQLAVQVNRGTLPASSLPILERWIEGAQGELLKRFLQAISTQMTKRVNYLRRLQQKKARKERRGRLLRSAPNPFGTWELDRQIAEILGFPPSTPSDWVKAQEALLVMDMEEWQKRRMHWRDTTFGFLQRQTLDRKEASKQALQLAAKDWSPARFLNLLIKPRPRWVSFTAGDFPGFQRFVLARAASWVEEQQVVSLQPQFFPLVETILQEVQQTPAKWLTRPVFKRQTIPLALGETQVYKGPGQTGMKVERREEEELEEMEEREEELEGVGSKEEEIGVLSSNAIPITLSLEAYKPLPFLLMTQKRQAKGKPPIDRYQPLLQEGFSPALGTVSLRPGGRLVLAIPFQRPQQPQVADEPIQSQTLTRIAGTDLGLKTGLTISVIQARQKSDGTWEPISRKDPTQTTTSIAAAEVARTFLDQHYLAGTRTKWIGEHAPPDLHDAPADPVPVQRQKREGRRRKGRELEFNWKRRLFHLWQETRTWQAKLMQYRAAFRADPSKHGIKVKHTQKHWKLRRHWQAAWRKLQNLHQELARQWATRAVAYYRAKGVQLIRLEEMSWARHKRKSEAGYFLASNQVHWFFSQVQERIVQLAIRAGMRIEWVNPRGTSTQCAICGQKGSRPGKGKRFICERHKEKYLVDADLNGARNIAVAPLAPSSQVL
jgi:transposase